jgi:acetoin utilization deacetylase AcuC-like enzyme
LNLVLLSTPSFRDHTPPSHHPERPERADVFDVVADAFSARGGRVIAPVTAPRDDLRRVHDDAYLRRLDAVRGRAAMLDPDTFTSPESIDVAGLAAGAALVALDEVLAGRARRAMALVRPPGHHAEADAAMGFCFLNNAAVAAAAALARGLSRVAIVDFDVHHGNGTEKTFDEDPRVLFVSTHEWPLYPGTGPATHTGRGRGQGFTVNVPIEAGATDADYALVFERVVEPAVGAFAPELVIVSAGFDAHERDPIAHMRLTRAGFAAIAASLARLADRHADGRLVAVTEGGYDLGALRESLEATVGALDGTSPPPGALGRPTGRGAAAVAAVRAVHGSRWGIGADGEPG